MSTKRWLDTTSEADGFERAILESGLAADPPPAAEHELWERLLVALPPPPIPGGGGGTGGAVAGLKSATTVLTLGKGFLLGVAATVAFAGADRVMHERQAARTPAPSVAASATPASVHRERAERARDTTVPLLGPANHPSSPAPEPEPAPYGASSTGTLGARSGAAVQPPEPPSLAPEPQTLARDVPPSSGSVAAFPLAEPAAAPRSRLEEEAALLKRARAELRRGALAAAFGTLEASRERFSAPELSQEREALLIELLYRSGQREQAAERARAFLVRFPESPLAEVVRGSRLAPLTTPR